MNVFIHTKKVKKKITDRSGQSTHSYMTHEINISTLTTPVKSTIVN